VLASEGTSAARMRQLLADVLGVPVVPLASRNVSAIGAALLGAKAAGVVVHVEVRTETPVSPRVDRQCAQDAYRCYLAEVARINS